MKKSLGMAYGSVIKPNGDTAYIEMEVIIDIDLLGKTYAKKVLANKSRRVKEAKGCLIIKVSGT